MTLFDTDQFSTEGTELQSVSGLLALMRIPGIGPRRAVEIARRYPTVEQLAAAVAVGAKVKVSVADVRELDLRPTEPAGDVSVVGFFDPDYPVALRKLRDAPAVVWYRGTLPSSRCVAIVGSRRALPWGEGVARQAARTAIERRFDVVSGLALGIDTVAHQAALDAGGRTWAVLGGGVDKPQPAANRRLAEAILNAGGGLLAEVPPGYPPSRHSLVARNRLQAALSVAVLVAQTGIPGGTLHTARFALEQGCLLIVASPTQGLAQSDAFAGNAALAASSGCDPAALGATGRLAETIRRRAPAADVVLHRADDLAGVWAQLDS